MSAARPVRVLHLIDGLAGGGSERWIWDLARLVDPARIRQRVVTIHPDLGRFIYSDRLRAIGVYGRNDARPSSGRTVLAMGATAQASSTTLSAPMHHWARGLWHWGAVFPSAGARIAAELIRIRPDVVHSHTYHAFPAALFTRAAARVPHVHTVPALISQMKHAGFGWTPGLYRRYHPRVSRFFTAYPAELAALGVPSSAIVELVGVIDTDALQHVVADRERRRAELRARIGAPPNAPVALSVGRLHSSKGHAYALEALPMVLLQHPDMHWVIAGEGTDRSALEARIRELGAASRVHLPGFVDDPGPLYAGADVYLRTNIFEADNLSSYQAMAAGLPVVGFATGAETELIDRVAHGILVPLGDVDRLAAAVVDMLSLTDRGRSIGARGVAYCREHLDIRRSTDLITATYESLARRELSRDVADRTQLGVTDRS